HVKADVGVAHHQVNRDQQDRAHHHQQGAFANFVHKQAKRRCAEHGEIGQDADQEASQGAAGTVGVDEELDGEGFERKNGRVKHDAEGDDVPIRNPEVKYVLEYNFVGRALVSQVVIFFCVDFLHPVNDGSDHAQTAETDGNK